MKRKLTVFEKHQMKIAIRTLKMNETMVKVMGGMSKDEAQKVLQNYKNINKCDCHPQDPCDCGYRNKKFNSY